MPTENGIITQTASFTPGGIPQRAGESGKVLFYSAQILVRKVVDQTEGFEDLVLAIAAMGGSALLDVVVNRDMPRI